MKRLITIYVFLLIICLTTVVLGDSAVPVNITGADGATNASHIDFSILDTIIGAIIAVIVVSVCFVLIGYFLIKFNVVTFSKQGVKVGCEPETKIPSYHELCEHCPEHIAEKQRSLRNERDIERLWQHQSELEKKIEDGFKAIALQYQTLLWALAEAGLINKKFINKEGL